MTRRYEYRVVNVDGVVEYQTTEKALEWAEHSMLRLYAEEAVTRLALQHDMTVCKEHRIERREIVTQK